MVYGGTLWVLAVTAWLSGSDWNRPTLLADLSHLGVLLFSIFSYLQLALFLFFSALATASAIALEKDRSTFLLLLITDLNNRELVAGKVFGSLLGILVLFLSGIPISLLLTVLGGVSYSQVFWVQAILLSTILAGGALGGLVALSRERTFQSLAMTALYLVSGLTVVRLSIVLDYLLPGHQQLFAGIRAALDPFQALGEILGSNGLSGAYACPLVMSLLALAFLSWGIAMGTEPYRPGGGGRQGQCPCRARKGSPGGWQSHTMAGNQHPSLWPPPLLDQTGLVFCNRLDGLWGLCSFDSRTGHFAS